MIETYNTTAFQPVQISNVGSFTDKKQHDLLMVELFCGSGNITRSFKDAGFHTFGIDNRKRLNVCEPDLKTDILKVDIDILREAYPDIIYAGVPCNAFSNAAGNYYRDGTGYKESTKYFQKLLKKTLQIIEEIKPALYYIENPKASLRYNKLMIDFLARTSGTIKQCTLSSYGFPTTKPTDIFTNNAALKLLPMEAYGRGAKCLNGNFNNLTQAQRQATPYLLGKSIAEQSIPVLLNG
jgi:hypothetical protein